MKLKGLAIAALSLGLTAGSITTASAAGDLYNWVGFSLGNTTYQTDNLSNITPGTKDDSGSAGKIFIGFPLTQTFGLEVGYMDLGKESIVGANGDTSEARAKVYNFDVVGNFAINDSFSILGKVGFVRWGMHSDTVKSGVASVADDDGFKMTYGLGMQFNASKEIGVRVEWERFDKLGYSGTTGEHNVDLISIGAVYNFKFF